MLVSCKLETQDWVISQIIIDDVIKKPTVELGDYYISIPKDTEFDMVYFLLFKSDKYIPLRKIEYDNDYIELVNIYDKQQRITFRALQKGRTTITLETTNYGVTGYDFVIY